MKGNHRKETAKHQAPNPRMSFLAMIIAILVILTGAAAILVLNGEILVAATKILNMKDVCFQNYFLGEWVESVFNREGGFLIPLIVVAWSIASFPIVGRATINSWKVVVKDYVNSIRASKKPLEEE